MVEQFVAVEQRNKMTVKRPVGKQVAQWLLSKLPQLDYEQEAVKQNSSQDDATDQIVHGSIPMSCLPICEEQNAKVKAKEKEKENGKAKDNGKVKVKARANGKEKVKANSKGTEKEN